MAPAGIFGASYYLIPEETEREIHSTRLAYIQFAILMLGAVGAVVGYIFRVHEGREFLEQPLWVKIGIIVAALIFLYNVTMTVLQGRKTAITNVLLLGLWGIAIFFLFALYNPGNLVIDKIYWWYVVHIWVEGVWELVMAAVLAFLMLKLTEVDREVIDKWLYAIAALSLFSGLLGTGHHYYWIGTPGYWQWVGSIFSSLEMPAILRHGSVHLLHGLEAQAGSPQQCGAALESRMRGARLFRGWRVGLHAYVPRN